MAITNGYCTLAEFKAMKDIASTDATDDGFIEDAIEAASRYIDGQTGRTFYARTETRYFSIPEDGGRQLDVDDDLLTITTLTNGDGDTIAATEYNFIPKNVSPKHAVKLKEASTEYWETDSESNTEYVISIAGTWGYTATTPDDIKEACLDIARSCYKRRFGGNESSDSIITTGGVVITPRDVSGVAARIIQRYRKWL